MGIDAEEVQAMESLTYLIVFVVAYGVGEGIGRLLGWIVRKGWGIK